MILHKAQNAIRNSFWGGVNKMIMTLFPFLIRTVIIKKLGTEYVGLNGLFTSILSVLNISELGISTAIVYSMYKPIAEENAKTICALMKFYKTAYRLISCFVFIVGILLIPFLDQLIKGPIDIDINIYILYLIYLGNSIMGYSMYAYKTCLFTAHQRNDISYRVQTAVVFIQYLAQILIIIFMKDYYMYVSCIIAATIMQNIILSRKADKEYPQYRSEGMLSEEILKEIKKQIGGLLIGNINVVIRNSMDSIFISSFIGLVAVGMYSNYYLIVTSVVGFISIISTSLIAGVGNSIVVYSIEKNYEDLKCLTFVVSWLVGFCSVCILCLIQPFMEIWVGKELMFHDGMAVICALYLLVGKIGLVRGIYTEALGLWWQMKTYSIVDIFVNFIMNLVLAWKWGAYGILFATVMCIGIYGVPYSTYILFKEYFGLDKYKDYMKDLFKYIMAACLIGAVTYGICSLIRVKPILKFVYCFFVCMIVPNVLYYIIYNRNQYFIYVKNRIKNSVF